MSTIPKPADDLARVDALCSYKVLDSLPERAYDEIVELASIICDTPIALVSLVDGERQWFKARVGLDAQETPRELAFCTYAIMTPQEPLIVEDATKDERFANNPLVLEAPEIRFYAGFPLNTEDGYSLGTLCAIDSKPKQITESQKHALGILANNIVHLLELRRAHMQRDLYKKRMRAYLVKVEQSNRDLEDFAYIISHDLKEPLRGVHTYASLLLRDYADRLDELGVERLEVLKLLMEGMEGKLAGLLRYSRLKAQPIEAEQVNMERLVEGVYTAFKPVLDNAGVEFYVETPLPLVEGEWVLLNEVLTNLIGNAVKFNDKEKKRIVVGCYEDEDRGTVFYVKDNGVGIRGDQQHEVFRVFRCLHGKKVFGEGVGLGLTIAKRIIEQHCGEIWLESEYGKGTIFYFTVGNIELCLECKE